jgi:hypothetical protein
VATRISGQFRERAEKLYSHLTMESSATNTRAAEYDTPHARCAHPVGGVGQQVAVGRAGYTVLREARSYVRYNRG